MKKLTVLFLSLIFVFALSSNAYAAYEIMEFNTDNAFHGEEKITDFELKGNAATKDIKIQQAVMNKLIADNSNIKFTLQDNHTFSIPVAALNTDLYKKTIKNYPDARVEIVVETKAGSDLYQYVGESVIQSKGFYPDKTTAFEFYVYLVDGSSVIAEMPNLGADVTATYNYDFGNTIEFYDVNPKYLSEKTLKFYALYDKEKAKNDFNLDWKYVGGTVDDKNDKITVSFNKSGFYCAMASANHADTNVNPGIEGSTNATTFSDVTAKHWAYSDITAMQAVNVIVNEGAKFYPARDITRAEFAVYLVRALGIAEDLTAANVFKDLKTTAPYYKEAVTAASSGLVSGKTATAFAPNDKITRQEMAVMMNRALEKINQSTNVGAEILTKFTDNKSIAGWAVEGAARAVNAGLITGKENSTFAPHSYTTRAEAIVMINRLYNKIK